MEKDSVKNNNPLILVVDDFKTTLLMTSRVLQKKGYSVVEAIDIQQAEQAFAEKLPDMVLINLDMSEKDGLTFCKDLKSLPSHRQRPILVYTSLEGEQIIETALNAGIDDFMVKPVNYQELSLRISRLLKLKELENVTNYQAYFDRLTGLPNQLLFQDRLAMAIKQAGKSRHQLAVMMVDVNDFKSLNTAYGYDYGDFLLKEISQRISSCIDEDATLARFNGDSFAILFATTSAILAADIAARIIDQFKQPFSINNQTISFSCSVGLSLYPGDGSTVQTLLINAEKAMQLVSEANVSVYRFYSQEMNKKTTKRLSLINELHQALANNEFVVYYQPLVDINTGKIVTAEALLRWQNPEYGPVNPAQFMPLAEDTGLILSIGTWALKEACLLGRSLQDKAGWPISIGVNFSALQFKQDGLLGLIAKAISDTAFDPALLKLEITETIAVQDPEYTVRVLKGLQKMGVKISIDDFGTGYSSLTAIKNMPFDELKIDMPFIRDMVNCKKNKAIVEMIVAFGKSMQANLVAEGVENRKQLLMLKEIGCDQAQGFLFSKPVSADVLMNMVKK